MDSLIYQNPEWEKEMDEIAKHWNKYDFYEEIDKIPSTNLSEEMKLVCEFNLRFQWVEHKVRELLWVLYGATSLERANIYLTNLKKKQIDRMNVRTLCEELKLFHIDEDGYRDTLPNISEALEKLSTTRNPVTHALYSEKLKEKQALVDQLKNRIAQLKTVAGNIEKITVPIMSIAAQVEIASKLRGSGEK